MPGLVLVWWSHVHIRWSQVQQGGSQVPTHPIELSSHTGMPRTPAVTKVTPTRNSSSSRGYLDFGSNRGLGRGAWRVKCFSFFWGPGWPKHNTGTRTKKNARTRRHTHTHALKHGSVTQPTMGTLTRTHTHAHTHARTLTNLSATQPTMGALMV